MSRKDCFGSGADIGAPTVHSRFVRSAAVEINLALCLLMADCVDKVEIFAGQFFRKNEANADL
ncbi:MAG TPA: hypothetical protein VMW24_02005 [Sedimentisphaerales bacterium]|nr:hypothetical protein [Sedimentisphaerales bacterium]